MASTAIDWAVIAADSRFQILHRRKARFLAGLMLASLTCFFLLPTGAAWYPGFFRLRVFGAVNVGILLAFSEFLMVWIVAALYLRRANREFDRLMAEVNAEIMIQYQRRERP